MTETFYWHDYETWGANPRRDRAAQFAGIRTDLEFKEIGEPLVHYCRPADDFLPHPEACLITGLTPQICRERGLPEAEFFQRIHRELSRPGTCGLGYNSLRFDDEITRFGFYRNFIDPYAREWQSGNSRWDLIDMVRLTRALRPDGIKWPTQEDGTSSFRLEALTVANNIEHQGAHDALADVRATIQLARLVKDRQPRLYDYVWRQRDKRKLADMLSLRDRHPVVHVSARYPARLGCIAVVVPVARHPTNKNGIVVYDLRVDPEPVLKLDAEEIRQRIYTPSTDLPEGQERIPLKTVHINRAPVIVPINTLTDAARTEWELDAEAERQHLERLRGSRMLEQKIASVFSEEFSPSTSDPDFSLYDGFFSNADRRRCEVIRQQTPEQLAGYPPVFDDPKLAEMLFRYRARNWPQTLTLDEQGLWDEFRHARLRNPAAGGGITMEQFQQRILELRQEKRQEPRAMSVLDDLAAWAAQLL